MSYDMMLNAIWPPLIHMYLTSALDLWKFNMFRCFSDLSHEYEYTLESVSCSCSHDILISVFGRRGRGIDIPLPYQNLAVDHNHRKTQVPRGAYNGPFTHRYRCTLFPVHLEYNITFYVCYYTRMWVQRQRTRFTFDFFLLLL